MRVGAVQVAVLAGVGPMFGMSHMQSIRSGLLLAAGGEFAFVAFGQSPPAKMPPHPELYTTTQTASNHKQTHG